MNMTLKTTLALVLALVVNGCGNDPPVATYGNDTGGAGGSGGAGGGQNPPDEGKCFDADGKPCSGPGTTGSNWAVASGDVFKTDPYNTWEFVSKMNADFSSCFSSSSCKKKIVDNDASVRWQYLGDGNYQEPFKGNLGMFAFGRQASTCGHNLQIQSDTEGLCWGEAKISSGARETFKSQKVLIGFENGDECDPGSVLALCENAITVTQYASGSTPPSPPPPKPSSFNSDGNGGGFFFAREWASAEAMARATSLEEMLTTRVVAEVLNTKAKISVSKGAPEGRVAREVHISSKGLRVTWEDNSIEYVPSTRFKGPAD